MTDQSRRFDGLMSSTLFLAVDIEALGRLFGLLRLIVVVIGLTAPVVLQRGELLLGAVGADTAAAVGGFSAWASRPSDRTSSLARW